jgi:hypothetical protein
MIILIDEFTQVIIEFKLSQKSEVQEFPNKNKFITFKIYLIYYKFKKKR